MTVGITALIFAAALACGIFLILKWRAEKHIAMLVISLLSFAVSVAALFYLAAAVLLIGGIS